MHSDWILLIGVITLCITLFIIQILALYQIEKCTSKKPDKVENIKSEYIS